MKRALGGIREIGPDKVGASFVGKGALFPGSRRKECVMEEERVREEIIRVQLTLTRQYLRSVTSQETWNTSGDECVHGDFPFTSNFTNVLSLTVPPASLQEGR